ncbi:MAG: DUF6324 family protein [Pseudomonadota bacterium]
MGINSESDVSATLTIGPTTEGMVRVYVEADGVELPMDFFPEEALEIAEELRLAAAAAARGGRKGAGSKKPAGKPVGKPAANATGGGAIDGPERREGGAGQGRQPGGRRRPGSR